MVLVEAQLHLPFFHQFLGLPHHPRPNTDEHTDNGGYGTWFHHFSNPDEHSFNSDSHSKDASYEDYGSFYHGDPYFQGERWNQIPGINNVFNIPNPSHHRHQPAHKGNHPQERPKLDHENISTIQKPEEKPEDITPINKKITDSKVDKDDNPEVNDKLNENNIIDVRNSFDFSPPKTNEFNNEDEKADQDNKQSGMNKQKDFLLVGQGNNGNNVHLLHENKPYPNTVVVPNGKQPSNNIMYVPYNPGQTSNPVYQAIIGQPGSLAANNVQITEDKMAVVNPEQFTTNFNTGNQNPGYVTIYSNGQFIQIPGVVVNSVPNNVPVQNRNPIQGTNYIIANAIPSNVQTVPAYQNTGRNVIYATMPQASNSPIYVQVPNCLNSCGAGTVQGVNNGMSNNGLPSNVVVYQAIPNTVAQPAVLPSGDSNGYAQPHTVANQGQGTITVAIPNQGTVFTNQNNPYQPVQLPINSGTNEYNQPITSNLGQGQNAPNQEGAIYNQNLPIQTPVVMPDSTNNNGNNQPTITDQNQQDNVPAQGVMYNQYTPVQPAVQVAVNNGINDYNQPILSNQGPNEPNQGAIVNNQNTPLQPAVVIPIPNGYNVNPPVTNPSPAVTVERRDDMPSNQNVQPQPANSGSNGYQTQVPNQEDQGTNVIVNTPNNDGVINQDSVNAQPSATSSLVLDSNNLSSLGAQPAIMISDFKDKVADKKDEKSKDKEGPKDTGKIKDKKSKDDDKPKDPEPFTNRVEDVKQ